MNASERSNPVQNDDLAMVQVANTHPSFPKIIVGRRIEPRKSVVLFVTARELEQLRSDAGATTVLGDPAPGRIILHEGAGVDVSFAQASIEPQIEEIRKRIEELAAQLAELRRQAEILEKHRATLNQHKARLAANAAATKAIPQGVAAAMAAATNGKR